jgi:hypothetical protein
MCRYATTNSPSTWHDSTVAGAVAERVLAGYCILADSAFFKTATSNEIKNPISKNLFHKAWSIEHQTFYTTRDWSICVEGPANTEMRFDTQT